MPNYQCPRCLGYFSRPQRVKSHLSRKNKCKIKNPNYTPESEGQILDSRKKNQKIQKKSEITHKICEQEQTLSNFVSSKNKVVDKQGATSSKKEFLCKHCDRPFTRKYNRDRHENNYCDKRPEDPKEEYVPKIRAKPKKTIHSQTQSDNEMINKLTLKIQELEQRLEENYTELREKPNIHNNILQVVCVGGNQNYLDMLTEEWGDYGKALDFIKDCALSNISGDCKLLEKIYFKSSTEAPIKYLDKNRNKIEYMNDQQEKIVDHKGQRLGRILANNLQNSYLKGVNYLITQNLSGNMCPNKFLDDYDVQSWNAHIYELSDTKYQRKIINTLEIPINDH